MQQDHSSTVSPCAATTSNREDPLLKAGIIESIILCLAENHSANIPHTQPLRYTTVAWQWPTEIATMCVSTAAGEYQPRLSQLITDIQRKNDAVFVLHVKSVLYRRSYLTPPSQRKTCNNLNKQTSKKMHVSCLCPRQPPPYLICRQVLKSEQNTERTVLTFSSQVLTYIPDHSQ